MGILLNDKLVSSLLDMAREDLCKRLYCEYQEHGSLRSCPSHEESKALVHILKTMLPFTRNYRDAHFTTQWLATKGRPRADMPTSFAP